MWTAPAVAIALAVGAGPVPPLPQAPSAAAPASAEPARRTSRRVGWGKGMATAHHDRPAVDPAEPRSRSCGGQRNSTGETVTPSDERVIDLIAQASPEGIEMLYDRYGRLAYTLALRVLGDAGAAGGRVHGGFLSE